MFRRDPLADPAPLIKRVYAYAAYRLGDGPEAEDATSETFERALRYKKSYDPQKGEPVAWLLGIAKRCIDGGWSNTEYASENTDSPDATDLEEETIRRLTVSRAVGALDERDRGGAAPRTRPPAEHPWRGRRGRACKETRRVPVVVGARPTMERLEGV